VFAFIKRKLRERSETNRTRDRVVFDEEGVMRTMANGQVEGVRWDDLVRVEIMTTDQGPFVDDVFWLLSAEDHGCAVPSESEGMLALLERLQELPGFDDEAVIRAMGCTDNEFFEVWSRRG